MKNKEKSSPNISRNGKLNKSVLLIEDDLQMQEFIIEYLKDYNFDCTAFTHPKDAIQSFKNNNDYEIIILDLMLPDMSGEEICQALRKKSRVPIIMLTAKVEEEDLLKGLNIGADDYVTKPFSPRQLVARVEAVLRRSSDNIAPLANTLSFYDDELVIDVLKYEVKKDGEIVSLTPNEYKLLLTMVKYPDKTFTRDELITISLGENFNGYDRTIDTHIKNLRQKIEPDPKHPKYILTIHGVGYRFGIE